MPELTPLTVLLLLLLLTLPVRSLRLEQLDSSPPAACRFRVEEELPAGATIDNSSLYACLGLEPLTGDTLTLTKPRGFDRGWERLRNLLSIDATGHLKVIGRLDRESPDLHCPARRQPCLKMLQAQLQNFNQPAGRMRLVNLQLAIEDKNDNDPAFGTEGRLVEVKENSMGQRRPLPVVVDPDAGDNGRTDVYIVDSSPEQRMRLDRLDNATGQLVLLIGDKLDYEILRNYSLTLEACDRGLQRRCARAELLVRILDENDNPPRFSRPMYRFEPVPEDRFAPGDRQLVGRVDAADADAGENARIVYSMESSGQSAASSSFAVDGNTGEVFLVGPVNAAGDATIEFTVRARDNGLVPLWTEARVQIPIRDINDHSPAVELQFPAQRQGLLRPLLMEATPAPNTCAFLKVSDGDLNENGQVSCSLGDGSYGFALIPLPGSPGGVRLYQVNATRVFDREAHASVTFQVVCRDHGVPSARTSSIAVTVDIGDINEWPPAFNSSVFTGNSVPENRANALAARVLAYDPDATASLRFAFSDEGTAKGCFVIDNRTGEIRTRRPLDREDPVFQHDSRSIYVVSVQVSDGERAATAQVEIRVTDENDHRPLLVGSGLLYTNETFADSSVWDMTVGKLAYTDADDPTTENAVASFSLLSSEPVSENVTFRVNGAGRVSANGRLDRESQGRYRLRLLLQDEGSPRLTSTATVTVSLMDLNDNAPVIEEPGFHQVIEVTDDHTPGMAIYSVRAHDPDICQLDSDIGPPRRLTGRDCHSAAGLSMRLSQRTRILAVNATTGELRVVNPLTPGLHSFNLTVTDRGSPRPLSSTVQFAVRVRRSESPFALGGGLGAASNWTLLLVVVVASSFLTLVLVIAIVLLNRRQPCDLTGASRSRRRRRDGYSGPKDQHCPETVGDTSATTGAAAAATPAGTSTGSGAFHGDQRPDCIGPLTTFGHGMHHMGTLTRENGNGSLGGSSGVHYPSGLPPNLFPPGDYEVASADSGHGASEEEMMHADHRLAMSEHLRYVTLPPSGSSGYQHPMRPRSPNMHCNCIVEEDFAAASAAACGHEHIPMTLTGQYKQQQQQQQQRHRQAASPSPSNASQSVYGQPALMLQSEPQFGSVRLQNQQLHLQQQQQQQQQYRSLSRPSSAASSRITAAVGIPMQQHQVRTIGNIHLKDAKSADV